MSDVDGSSGGKNCENAGIIEAGGVCQAVFGLGVKTESVSTCVCLVARLVIYLGAAERRARPTGVSDAESVLGEGVQDSAGIVEEFEGLVTGVGNGRGHLQVL